MVEFPVWCDDLSANSQQKEGLHMIVFRNLHLALLLTLVLGLGVLGSMWQAQQEETRRQKELRMVVQAVAALINTMDSQEWDNCLAAMKNDSCRIVQNVLQGIRTELEGCSRALLLAYTPSNGPYLMSGGNK